ncbi:hypothetical protein V8E52_008695 [Russula decolorans]
MLAISKVRVAVTSTTCCLFCLSLYLSLSLSISLSYRGSLRKIGKGAEMRCKIRRWGPLKPLPSSGTTLRRGQKSRQDSDKTSRLSRHRKNRADKCSSSTPIFPHFCRFCGILPCLIFKPRDAHIHDGWT